VNKFGKENTELEGMYRYQAINLSDGICVDKME